MNNFLGGLLYRSISRTPCIWKYVLGTDSVWSSVNVCGYSGVHSGGAEQ